MDTHHLLRRLFHTRAGQSSYHTVLAILRDLPLPSTVLGPVKGSHSSLRGWLENPQNSSLVNGNTGNLWIVDPGPEETTISPPPTLAVPRVPKNLTGNEIVPPTQLYLGQLIGGRIATRRLEVISLDDHVFDDLFFHVPGNPNPAQSLKLPLLPRLKRRDGIYATICTTRAGNYYHWINDCLTRLWILDVMGVHDYRLILPKKRIAFQQESLALLGFTAERLARFGHEHWSVERLLVPSLTNGWYRHSSPAACRWLREKLTPAAGPSGSPVPKRVYISRALASKRRLLNEDEIVPFLRRFGFVSVQTETMTFQEQIHLFREAEAVVAPHGAGLANIVFMKEGALVLEMVHYRRTKPTFYSLANARGLTYCILTDAPDNPDEERTDRPPDIDFTIPLERVSDALRSLGL